MFFEICIAVAVIALALGQIAQAKANMQRDQQIRELQAWKAAAEKNGGEP